MSYEYMTPEEFAAFTNQSLAAIAPIDPADKMTLAAMLQLKETTNGRFSFNPHDSGRYARCVWVNYYQTDVGNYRVDKKSGAASLGPHQQKDIELGA